MHMNDDKDRRDLLDEAEPDEQPGSGSEALVEAPDSAVQRLEGQVAELQDRHLRLAAEYDNYRKRTAKERTESWHKAQVDLLAKLIDALDDLARFAQVDPS